jgi:Asp-tRNA(Asn)/Glu-tRNA(Gln) amidotransferase A subunit family amidase
MQLAGRHLDEGLLLRAVDAFQKATGWHACHPVDLCGAFHSLRV